MMGGAGPFDDDAVGGSGGREIIRGAGGGVRRLADLSREGRALYFSKFFCPGFRPLFLVGAATAAALAGVLLMS